MASAADFNVDFGLGRADGENLSTTAFDFSFGIIFWMDVFHKK